MDSMGIFHEDRGHIRSGRTLFKSLGDRWRERLAGRTIKSAESADVRAETAHYLRESADDVALLARAMAWQSAFEVDEKEAEATLHKSVALLEDPGVDEEVAKAARAFACYRLGHIYKWYQSGRAIANLEQGLGLYRELGDLWGVAYCLRARALAGPHHLQQRQYSMEAIEAFEKTGDDHGLAQALSILTVVSVQLGDYETMENAHGRNLSLAASFEQPLLFLRKAP